MTNKKIVFFIILLTVLMGMSTNIVSAVELKTSTLNKQLLKIKYSSAALFNSEKNDVFSFDQQMDEASNWGNESFKYEYKSPGKAFFLSLAVPGLGQYYYGSKMKSVAFLGVEAASWFMYFKYDGDGNDLTDKYEAFSQAHWDREDYEAYLLANWGVTSDQGINDLTHHLPSTNTQQYYEMTGKYDQFAWAWDDAALDGHSLDEMIAYGGSFAINTADSTTIPSSANRFLYEGMRDNANNKFDQAKRMSYVAMINHVFSAFEALFTTRRHNENLKKAKNEFTHWNFKASLKSSYAKYDTPYLKITYKL